MLFLPACLPIGAIYGAGTYLLELIAILLLCLFIRAMVLELIYFFGQFFKKYMDTHQY